jgi:hypothetical protein
MLLRHKYGQTKTAALGDAGMDSTVISETQYGLTRAE